MAPLPAEHVQGRCGCQTGSGCALPRERHADLCNVYRCNVYGCDAPATPARHVSEAPAAAVLTCTHRRPGAVVVFRHGRATPLAGVPRPEDLPA